MFIRIGRSVMRSNTRTVKQRLEPEAFYNAGFRLLAEGGAEELTVDGLCAVLGVTKGSFYHHFANTAEYVAGLLASWEGTVDRLVELDDGVTDPARRLEAVWPVAINRPHEAEAALRSWANSNPTVAVVVRRVDQKLETLGAEMIEGFIGDPERARLLSWMWLRLVAGMQQVQPIDRQRVTEAALEFMRTNGGIDVEVDDQNRLTVHSVPRPGGRSTTKRAARPVATRKAPCRGKAAG
jgi:AcrR family transcriptional regulator